MMLPTKKITKGDVKKLAKIKNKSKKSRGQLKFWSICIVTDYSLIKTI